MAAISAPTQWHLQALAKALARPDAPPVVIEDTYFLAMDEGEKVGAVKASAKAVLAVLTARGLEVTEAQRAKVIACADLATLEGWIKRAVTLPTTEEVLREPLAAATVTPPRKRTRRP